jgi:hypothetical protein
MAFRGDMNGLGQLALNVEKLARVPAQVSKSASVGIRAALQEQFSAGTDPYGHPWKPLKPSTIKAGRHSPPLTNTRKMRDHDLEVKPLPGAGISVTFSPDAPAIFHQKGTPTMAARPILPTNVMPAPWNRALSGSSSAAVKRALGGR